MTDNVEPCPTAPKALGDVPAERVCLRCGAKFWSEGFGERICKPCKSSATWRANIPFSDGQGWRGSSGRGR